MNGWAYDGPRLVAELDASGAVLSRFYYGANGHAPHSMVRAGVSYRIVTDQLGSPRLVVNGSTVSPPPMTSCSGEPRSDTREG